MNSKSFLIILLFLFWSFGSGWYYVCKVKQVCPSSVVSNDKAIQFNLGEAEPQLGSSFGEFKSSLMEKVGETNGLVITGIYGENETNQTALENIGIARALAVQSLFDSLGQDRVQITSKTVNINETQKIMDGVSFRIVTKNDFVEETDFGGRVYTSSIGASELDTKVTAFLAYLAIESQGKQMDVIGHSTSESGEGDNYTKSLELANMVKDALVANGANETYVNVSAKGETEPLGDKSSEEGIKLNNRVDILIN